VYLFSYLTTAFGHVKSLYIKKKDMEEQGKKLTREN